MERLTMAARSGSIPGAAGLSVNTNAAGIVPLSNSILLGAESMGGFGDGVRSEPGGTQNRQCERVTPLTHWRNEMPHAFCDSIVLGDDFG